MFEYLNQYVKEYMNFQDHIRYYYFIFVVINKIWKYRQQWSGCIDRIEDHAWNTEDGEHEATIGMAGYVYEILEKFVCRYVNHTSFNSVRIAGGR